jgi:hypothetical protein
MSYRMYQRMWCVGICEAYQRTWCYDMPYQRMWCISVCISVCRRVYLRIRALVFPWPGFRKEVSKGNLTWPCWLPVLPTMAVGVQAGRPCQVLGPPSSLPCPLPTFLSGVSAAHLVQIFLSAEGLNADEPSMQGKDWAELIQAVRSNVRVESR